MASALRIVATAALCIGVVASCTNREVDVSFHTPSSCCQPPPGSTECSEPVCPMESLASIELLLFRSSGELVGSSCVAKPAGACNYEDLQGTELLADVAGGEGLDIVMEGFVESDCRGRRHFICDTPGEGLVDLDNERFPVALWCSCAPIR